MLTKHTSYKYKTPYTGPFVITQCSTNGRVNLQCVPTKIGITYEKLSHTNMILKLKILIRKIYLMMSAYDCQLYTFVLTNKALKKVYNWMRMKTLALSHLGRAHFFMTTSFYSQQSAHFGICDPLRKGS